MLRVSVSTNPYMTEETRKYLLEVSQIIERRAARRGHTRAAGKLTIWEKKILDGAKRLLRENQTDLPLGVAIPEGPK